MSNSKKLAFFLPNIFTALNMACGFVSIMFSSKGKLYEASMILVLGAIFDSVDGRVARMTGTESQFGEQFDSMSDLISFGIAPALLMYHYSLYQLGRIGMVVSFSYLLCGALRLARFNANVEKVSPNFFQGLPIPGACMGLIGFVLLSLENFEWVSFLSIPWVGLVSTIFFALLMISNIPFSSFKNSPWVRKNKKGVFVIILLLLASLFTYEEVMIALIIFVYVFGSLIYFFTHKGALEDVFSWKNDNDEEA